MNSSTTLSTAIAAILGVSTTGAAYAQTVPAVQSSATSGIEEIVVTAQRRSESCHTTSVRLPATRYVTPGLLTSITSRSSYRDRQTSI